MTPRDKATELFRRFWQAENKFGQQSIYRSEAIACALIAVEEILDFMTNKMSWDSKTNGNIHYWQEVKEEINKI